MHQAQFCFHHDVVTGPAAVGTCLTIAGDASINETWIQLVDSLKIEIVFLKGVWKVVFHKDIGVFDELVKNFDSCVLSKG